MKRIVTITPNPAIDVSSSVHQVLAGRKLRCSRPRFEAGGGGINVSRAIGRLGGETTAIFAYGGDRGALLTSLLDREGIDYRAVATGESTRENVSILEELSGQTYRFVMPGSQLIESEWTMLLEELVAVDPKPDYVIGSGSLPEGVPPDFYAQVAVLCRELGAKFILDTSGEPLGRAMGSGVFLAKPNLREFSELAGEEMTDEPQQEMAAMRLIESGACEALVVTMGAGGALLATQDGVERFGAPSVRVKSRIGAGDSMVAGIAVSLARGNMLRDSVLFGLAAGSAATMTPGSELCRIEDTDRLFERLRLKSVVASA